MLAYDESTFPPTVKQVPSGQVLLRDSMGCPAEIKKLSANEPNKGLGIHLAASGSMDVEHCFRLSNAVRLRVKPTLQT